MWVDWLDWLGELGWGRLTGGQVDGVSGFMAPLDLFKLPSTSDMQSRKDIERM